MSDNVLYFAYGSNMYAPRMRERIQSAEIQDIAVLEDYRLRFHKRGQDGSGKCDIVKSPGHNVFGVLYAVSPGALLYLDQIEAAPTADQIELSLDDHENVRGADYYH